MYIIVCKTEYNTHIVGYCTDVEHAVAYVDKMNNLVLKENFSTWDIPEYSYESINNINDLHEEHAYQSDEWKNEHEVRPFISGVVDDVNSLL